MSPLDQTTMTLEDALINARRAKEWIDEASELLHEISVSGFPKIISDEAYRCDKKARDASMWIACNYAGLIDRISAQMTDAKGSG